MDERQIRFDFNHLHDCAVRHRRWPRLTKSSPGAPRTRYAQTYPQGIGRWASPRFSPVRIARVALDVPLEDAFDFRLPEDSDPRLGALVVVPFGRARKVGLVVARSMRSDVPLERLRDIERVIADVPPVGAAELALFRFCARYYHRALGEVIAAPLPPA